MYKYIDNLLEINLHEILINGYKILLQRTTLHNCEFYITVQNIIRTKVKQKLFSRVQTTRIVKVIIMCISSL